MRMYVWRMKKKKKKIQFTMRALLCSRIKILMFICSSITAKLKGDDENRFAGTRTNTVQNTRMCHNSSFVSTIHDCIGLCCTWRQTSVKETRIERELVWLAFLFIAFCWCSVVAVVPKRNMTTDPSSIYFFSSLNFVRLDLLLLLLLLICLFFVFGVYSFGSVKDLLAHAFHSTALWMFETNFFSSVYNFISFICYSYTAQTVWILLYCTFYVHVYLWRIKYTHILYVQTCRVRR